MALGDIIFKKGDDVDAAYMLMVGSVEYKPCDDESFMFTGANMIFGASEILIQLDDPAGKNGKKRHLSVIQGNYCKISKIPKKNLKTKFQKYNVGFNIAKNIASNIVKLHTIVNTKNNKLGIGERLARDYCKVFSTTILLLEQAMDEHNASYLSGLVSKYKETYTYKYGESLIDQTTQTKYETDSDSLSKFKKVYPAGAVIMREGDEANEMYILSEGKIGVYIQDKQIDTIKDKGSIIGEMGFINNESRSATLIADDETSLIVVDKSQIRSFFEGSPDIFIQMLTTLAKRELYLCNLITELDELINQTQNDFAIEMKQVENYKKELNDLHDELRDIVMERRTEFLNEIMEKLVNDMRKLGD